MFGWTIPFNISFLKHKTYKNYIWNVLRSVLKLGWYFVNQRCFNNCRPGSWKVQCILSLPLLHTLTHSCFNYINRLIAHMSVQQSTSLYRACSDMHSWIEETASFPFSLVALSFCLFASPLKYIVNALQFTPLYISWQSYLKFFPFHLWWLFFLLWTVRFWW